MIIPIKPWLDRANGAEGKQGGLVLAADAEAADFLRSTMRGGLGLKQLEEGYRMEFYHQPIMGKEVLAAMAPLEGKQVFDGTLGGGGHTELFLEHGTHVVGCDQDAEALGYAERRLSQYEDQFLPVRGNFAEMDKILQAVGIDQVDGVLMDLGVSSHQLDEPSRGFSFREDGPLDMRMDVRAEFSARELVNEWAEEDMIRIFREYGEEKRAVRAAKEIVKARRVAPIETTLQLAEVVEKAVPRISGKHPATRVFQAIRIAVNREMEVLATALDKSIQVLSEGGVLAVITFHSLEDRMVKLFMRRHSTPFLDRPEWPEPRENPDYCLTLPSRRAIAPSEAEIKTNPRARSARLRVAVKLEG
ncbi:MAG: 16S rRNA (cytosine(1402)-N(4))-methyltransferase RsmH [Verrucomicrobiales bacterium]